MVLRSAPTCGTSVYSSPTLDPDHSLDSSFQFETIDLFNGGVYLGFDDLTLPGDGGHHVAVTRTYASKLNAECGEPSSYGVG